MILQGDALTQLKTMSNDSIDAIVTDPPYGYSFMNKDWDKAVIGVDTWIECLRVLKPGAFAAIMSSPRQDVLSRMIVNLQTAGFRTDFTSIYWTYASGFPKAANISKLVDKREGAERNKIHGTGGLHRNDTSHDWSMMAKKEQYLMSDNIPITEKAKELDGSYAGFQPKPAVEVILIVMKPLSEETFVDQALKNGKGITWLDSVRIPYQSEDDKNNTITGFNKSDSKPCNPSNGWNSNKMISYESDLNQKGRFPANLLVSDDVLNDGKIRKSTPTSFKNTRNFDPAHGWNNNNMKSLGGGFTDSGSYSRYFSLDKWFETTFPFVITPKASSSERNRGLDAWIPQKVNDGRKASHDTPHLRAEILRKNTHPTVKPIKLMSYLVALLTKEGETVLDPFCGSGSTLIAAQMLNRKYIGIELNTEYIQIANKRLSGIL